MARGTLRTQRKECPGLEGKVLQKQKDVGMKTLIKLRSEQLQKAPETRDNGSKWDTLDHPVFFCSCVYGVKKNVLRKKKKKNVSNTITFKQLVLIFGI